MLGRSGSGHRRGIEGRSALGRWFRSSKRNEIRSKIGRGGRSWCRSWLVQELPLVDNPAMAVALAHASP